MAYCILASRGALLYLTVRLKDVHSPIAFQSPLHKVVEPGFGKLPITTMGNPNWIYSAVILEPRAIVHSEREAGTKFLPLACASKDYGNFVLIPNSFMLRCFTHSCNLG